MHENLILERLQRMESRLVRGFSEMGVRVTDDSDWFTVNRDAKVVFLKSSGKSIASIWLAMRAAGCEVGETYHLFVGEQTAGTIQFAEPR